MLQLPNLSELHLVGVADRGVPNKERIIFRPREVVELQRYFVGLGFVTDATKGLFLPHKDRIFYFPEAYPTESDWVVLYTGKGQETTSELPTTGETAHTFFWGAENVLFTQSQVIPTLFRIGALQIPEQGPLNLPGYKPAGTFPRQLPGPVAEGHP